MASAIVLSDANLLELIFEYLDAPYVAGMRYVCKTFDRVGSGVFERKQKTSNDIVWAMYMEFNERVRSVIFEGSWASRRDSVRANATLVDIIDRVCDADWSILVHVPEMMDDIAYAGSALLWTWPFALPSERLSYARTFRRIAPYIYLTDPNEVDLVSILKGVARLKGIKGAAKMRRSKLVRLLTRPDDEHYPYTL